MTGDRRTQSQEPVHKRYILTRLWQYLSRYKGMLILAAVLAVLSNLAGAAGPQSQRQSHRRHRRRTR